MTRTPLEVNPAMITNPGPQRSLRGHRPKRLSGRTAATGDYLARLAPRLTPRDRWLARLVYEHRVLTTPQLAQLAWPTLRAANQRLLQLYRWRVLDRFQPFVTYGSAPMHYVLDVAGASVLAREDGMDIQDLGYRHDHALGIAHSLRLNHIVGTNGFFTSLIAHSRASNAQLTAWWSEARCHEHFGDVVRPDAYGRWREDGREFEWFLEHDCGTERPADRVGAKLPHYAKLAESTGITTPVLVWTPTAQREARIRHAVTEALVALTEPASVPLATTSAESSTATDPSGPADTRWLPLTPNSRTDRRLALAELPSAWPYLNPLATPPSPTADSPATNQILPPLHPQATPIRNGAHQR
ncbi:replication-relaxation family protein [Streptomyces sp. NPDC059009]|uniref:replication-relaxation family protein n=1 Tax=Streptomyces sp. NPDC059009 TaxID=3346694 RepID=UPI00369560D9